MRPSNPRRRAAGAAPKAGREQGGGRRACAAWGRRGSRQLRGRAPRRPRPEPRATGHRPQRSTRRKSSASPTRSSPGQRRRSSADQPSGLAARPSGRAHTPAATASSVRVASGGKAGSARTQSRRRRSAGTGQSSMAHLKAVPCRAGQSQLGCGAAAEPLRAVGQGRGLLERRLANPTVTRLPPRPMSLPTKACHWPRRRRRRRSAASLWSFAMVQAARAKASRLPKALTRSAAHSRLSRV